MDYLIKEESFLFCMDSLPWSTVTVCIPVAANITEASSFESHPLALGPPFVLLLGLILELGPSLGDQ